MLNRYKNNFKEFLYRRFRAKKLYGVHKILIEQIKERGHANIVFVVSSLPMWRNQGLYELLVNDSRFTSTIVICPFLAFSQEQRAKNVRQLREYFDSKMVPYIDTTVDVTFKLESLNPDVLFYTQQYYNLVDKKYDSKNFDTKLLCFCPYGFNTISTNWTYNNLFQVVAWKLFYETNFHKHEGERLCDNKGINIEVVGEAHADEFLSNNYIDNWKEQADSVKRIIWAPHFTVNNYGGVDRASFLWIAEEMLNIAKEYKGKIQIAFKPHPRLLTELYIHKDWGRERADKYYNEWKDLENGQFEDGIYTDLFMTSDAMIHDCGSFTVEYHYSQKPVMFLTKDINQVSNQLNSFGKEALDLHYIGQNSNDVRKFIDEVVLKGEDPKLTERAGFFNKYLLPPDTGNVALNTYNVILKALELEK